MNKLKHNLCQIAAIAAALQTYRVIVPAPATRSSHVRSPFPDIRRARKRRGADGAAGGVSRGTGAAETDADSSIPRADQQQNEYVAPSEERLAWLTGFTGSAGLAIVLTQEAAVFVDGRYTLQAAKQVDAKAWNVEPLIDPPPESWLTAHLAAGDRLGFDPWLHTSAAAERLAAACAKAGAELVAVDSNPLDSVWTERPQPPLGPVAIHGTQFSGEAEADKLAAHPRARSASSASMRWCCRIRTRWPGPSTSAAPTSRIRRCRCPTRWCRRTAGRPCSSITANCPTARATISSNPPMSHEPDALTAELTALAQRGASIALDSATAADALSRLIDGGRRQGGARQRSGRAAEGRARTPTEIEGTRTAHRRDAVALARFLAWIDREAPIGRADRDRHRRGAGDLSPRHRRAEGRVVSDHRRHRAERRHRALPRHPQDQPADRAGRSAADRFRRAIRRRHHRRHPHHRDRRRRPTKCATASPACCAAISRSRARCFPTAPPARSSIRWRGNSLWQAGLDFEHGTGHGVGSYLSVHEGPARISKLGTTPLQRGMILSNEPGYYKTDAYGIRIENLELVVGSRHRRRREADERVRDADPGADRPPPDRRRHARAATNCAGSTTTTPASATRCGRMLDEATQAVARRRRRRR